MLSVFVHGLELVESLEFYGRGEDEDSCLLCGLSNCCYFCEGLEVFALEVLIIDGFAYSAREDNRIGKGKVWFSDDGEVLVCLDALGAKGEDEAGSRPKRFECTGL